MAEKKEIQFHEVCPELADTELYRQFKAKAENDHAFLAEIENLCYDGVILSKDVIRFFPTFTLHDGTHIRGVCRWMERLLGVRINDLTAEEAAMLLLAACWHDSGMCVSDTQRKQFEEELCAEEQPEDWVRYFHRHPGDEVAYSKIGKLTEEERSRFMDGLLRRFIRENHPARACGTLDDWPDALLRHGLQKDALVALCRSHGEKLEHSYGATTNCDLNLCAVLLRLADALNYDASRTPDILFHQLGLDEPENAEQAHSRESWRRTGAGDFGEISFRAIPYTACFKNPQLEHDVVSYLNWLQGELLACGEFLASFAGRWQTFQLPQKISQNISREGYKAGNFHLTMDQDRVLELLTGRTLYSDPGVFVRELLQNAIDAVLMRRRVDPSFGKKDGKIVIRTWTEGDDCWFRIEDNGVGMDEHILTDYFLKVGRSYYTSDEFRAALLHGARDTDFHPISRFGIGILSCFMSDPNNTLELETKRYSGQAEETNPILRLRVTGLHGYYFLTEPTRDKPGKELPRPPKQQCKPDGYLHGVGTTVCTRINFYELGGRSIKSLVDKYLCFPAVKVEYYGEEGNDSYPMKEKFIDVIHRLGGKNPKEPTPHIHPLSDSLFKILSQELPFACWCERPSLVLRYYPIDLLSETGSVMGVVIRADMQVPPCKPLVVNGVSYELTISSAIKRAENTSTLSLEWFVSISNYNLIYHASNVTDSDYYDMICRRNTTTLTFEVLSEMLSSDERWLFSCLQKQRSKQNGVYGEKGGAAFTETAFNGVLVDNSDLLSDGSQCLSITLLLEGSNVPQVSLSRDNITAIPLELACELRLKWRLLPFLNERYVKNLDLKYYLDASTSDYCKLLTRHPDWADILGAKILGTDSFRAKEDVDFQTWLIERDLGDMLLLSAMRQHFSMVMDTPAHATPSFIAKLPEPNEIDGFPPCLFCHMLFAGNNGIPFRNTKKLGGIIYYNIHHSFSKWLIKKGKDLQEKMPGHYQRLLEIMIMEDDDNQARKKLNDILNSLRSIPGNPFDINDDMMLKDTDFWNWLVKDWMPIDFQIKE